MFLCNTFFGNLVTVIAILITTLIAYYKWKYQYWRKRNIPYIEPTIPWGTGGNPFILKENGAVLAKRFYDFMKSKGWKHGGLFTLFSPGYLVVDLEYVKNIMTKDFDYFTDRGFYYNEKDDPLSAHLFSIDGQKWRNLRTKLSPTFTSGKMKMMFQTLTDCTPNLLKQIDFYCATKESIDIREVLGCFTTDIIGSCAFGLDCNTFKEKNSPFREYGRRAFVPTKIGLVRMMFGMNFPNTARSFGITAIDKDVSDFFMKVVKDTVKYREENNYSRKDFIQLLIDLKNNKPAEEEGYKHDITIEEIAAQSFVFFVAGFETSSTAMTFLLYELGRNPNIQQKVRDEVNLVLTKYDGKITYEGIQEMKYLEQVINETFRMYPPVPILLRKCVKDYQIPDQDIVIEKGVNVFISTLGIHYDKGIYSEPEKFDPERFTEENKNARHHYAHLPFGEGPRICIGLRFGMMQSKVGLAALLKNYKFSVSRKTKEPLKMKAYSFILAPEGEIWLHAEKV